MKTLSKNRIKRFAPRTYSGKRYQYLKAKGICVCCGDRPAAFRVTMDDTGKVEEKRKMVKCWPCTLQFRAYQKARS